ncbi:Hsp70 family protein [bacterium]|nr:Hsp70 family protein [bacterium]
MSSRYVVGLDLGTTNVAVAYVDTDSLIDGASPSIEIFRIPQLVKEGEIGSEDLLPSFLYLPGEGEIDTASLALPWAKKRDFAVGSWGRDRGATTPTRLVSSAKSWLTHGGVDRRAPLLPWGAEPEFPKISPVEASRRLLEHVRDAWNETAADKASRLENQEIILTVPASFDAVARELTIEAARQACLENVVLFEEPLAAFYAWLHQAGDAWRSDVRPGDVVLVVDVGGGTSDFTLVGVSEQGGDLSLERIAVGDHLLLGGDNMDLTLASHAAEQMRQTGAKVDRIQMLGLWHAAREAKEKVFSSKKGDSVSLAVLGRGRKVIGGALKTELSRQVVEETLMEGFFPKVPLGEEPTQSRSVGLQEIGLPYVTDPAITRHLSAFVSRHEEELRRFVQEGRPASPSAILFNGGVFQAETLRNRVREVVSDWNDQPARLLSSAGLDRAVAFGGAYYGLVRRGRGVRVRGGVARSYYIGIESAMPAVPGMARSIRAVCLVPQGTEEGTSWDLSSLPLGLVVGEPVEFRFLSSTQRKEDRVGTVVDDWEDQIEPLAPLEATLEPKPGQTKGQTVPVFLQGQVTDVGTLEIWCQTRDATERWKLEFNVRQPAMTRGT